MTDTETWLTRQEAAAYLKISLRQLTRLRLLRSVVGKRTPRYAQSTLDRYLARRADVPAIAQKSGPSRPLHLSSPIDGDELIRRMREHAARAPRSRR